MHPYRSVVIAGVFIRIGVTVGTVAVPDRAATGVLGRLDSLPAGIDSGTGATLRLVAELSLEKQVLKDVAEGNF